MTVRTDGEMAWVRRRASDGAPVAFFLVEGRWIEVDGNRLVDAPARLRVLAGELRGEQWQFEGAAAGLLFNDVRRGVPGHPRDGATPLTEP